MQENCFTTRTALLLKISYNIDMEKIPRQQVFVEHVTEFKKMHMDTYGLIKN